MTGRRTVACVAVAAVLGVGLCGAVPAGADNPLDKASQAAETVAFSGRLRLEWVDEQGRHATEVNVRSAAGQVRIDGPQPLVATANYRYVLRDNAWDLLAPGDPSMIGAYPPMTRKYQIVQTSGPNVIGRPTTEVDLMVGPLLAARMYVDQATGLLLRREELDASGQPVRVVSFVQLSVGQPAGMAAPHDAVDQRPPTIGVSALPAPYHAPARLSQGYQRVAVLRRFDGIEVVYSDGLHSLSVFERPGHLGTTDLPSGGSAVAVGRWQAYRYAWPGGQVVVWHAGDSSYTVVGDAPAAEVVSAIATLPSGGVPTPLQRMRRACRRLVQAVSGEW